MALDRPEVRRHVGRHARAHPRGRAPAHRRARTRGDRRRRGRLGDGRRHRRAARACARSVSADPPEREMDMLLATGEQVSIALLAMAIHALGPRGDLASPARRSGIVTDAGHTQGARSRRSVPTACARRSTRAGSSSSPASRASRPTGRSPRSAAAAPTPPPSRSPPGIGADVCEIYTDVDGVYTADPRIVPDARKIDAHLATRRCSRWRRPARGCCSCARSSSRATTAWSSTCRSSFNDSPGTIVKEADATMEQAIISGVTHDTSEAKITIRDVPDRPGVAADVFTRLAEANVNVDMIIQNVSEDGHDRHLVHRAEGGPRPRAAGGRGGRRRARRARRGRSTSRSRRSRSWAPA